MAERPAVPSAPARPRRARTIAAWILTVLAALGIGLAGVAKFAQADNWQSLFAGWRYPSWMSPTIGVAEIAGAIILLIPRTAVYGAILLGVIMAGALITLLSHPGGKLGWGATPAVYLVVLALVGWARWSQRVRA